MREALCDDGHEAESHKCLCSLVLTTQDHQQLEAFYEMQLVQGARRLQPIRRRPTHSPGVGLAAWGSGKWVRL